MADAIIRTLVRLFITRKHMLEWVTAAQATNQAELKLYSFFGRMLGGTLVAIAALGLICLGHPQSLPIAMPFVAVWLASPAIAYWISLPSRQPEKEKFSETHKAALRETSRRTWRFFEQFVTPEDQFLPPDNFQETPRPVVAHRTSPTNIGLYLLSTMAARDFGWLGTLDMSDRLDSTIETMKRMEMFRGHLYNWYDTRDLHPLDPKYISSVDSGNLAGNLLTLASGCRELIQKSRNDDSICAGLGDAIRVLRKSLADVAQTNRSSGVAQKRLANAIDALETSIQDTPHHVFGSAEKALELSDGAKAVFDLAQALTSELGGVANTELTAWASAVKTCADSHLRDAHMFFPWLQVNGLGVRAAAAGVEGGTVAYAATTNKVIGDDSPEWKSIEPLFRTEVSLDSAQERFEAAIQGLTLLRENSARGVASDSSDTGSEEVARIDTLIRAFEASAERTAEVRQRLLAIADWSEEMFESMDFSFLFDSGRQLLSIGYRAADGSLDPNFYDLLASEARLASFIAIAKGDVPPTHWFHLGRPLTPVGKGSALISWSGSMFEYLMPALMMRSPYNSLLNQTYQQIVTRQIGYGTERGVPWGISESAYSARDIDFTYQYSSFGVPGLGLKRGLSNDLVIAPYATGLAAMVDPVAAFENFERLASEDGRGSFGFYDALDYTASRLPEGKRVEVVRTYMAHHQGMVLISLANVVNDNAMYSRFHAAPIIQATELLLQERTPRDVLVARPRAEEVSGTAQVREFLPPSVRRFSSPSDATPRTQLLSNGRYSVMLTAAGSGYSRWRDIAVTRWREDATRDCWGNYIFLRDQQTGNVWSVGYQPIGAEPDSYEAAFFEDHAEIVRRDRSLTTTMEVIVSSEDDCEMRHVSITNNGIRTRDIQVTSYAEICLITQNADAAHPAFANLFVETEFVPDMGVLLATRRKRSEEEPSIWCAHVLVTDEESSGPPEYETDRAKFVGRGRSLRNPASVMDGRKLSGSVGSVLDPILSLRRTVRIAPGKTAHLIFSTLVASTREDVLNIADKYRDPRITERTLTLAWTQAQVQLRHLGISTEEAHLFQTLANAVLYSDAALRPGWDLLSNTTLDVHTLWSQGISGDLPIVVARIDDADDIELVRQLLRAHEYWRMKQLSADVVIINEKSTSYVQDLQNSLEALVHGSQLRLAPDSSEASGKIFLLRGDLIPAQTRAQLQAVARVVLLSKRGTLAEQISRLSYAAPPTVVPVRPFRTAKYSAAEITPPRLQQFNGLGGFTEDGREYAIVLSKGLRTPEPWVNVIANPDFGFLVSESGS
ncbi:MAG TPA: glucoamylase family protein, partial [Candidatus Acidoferrales bacterium]|nr:glucoamylase family protein [Candidatus Acidoferrales bacterium]